MIDAFRISNPRSVTAGWGELYSKDLLKLKLCNYWTFELLYAPINQN